MTLKSLHLFPSLTAEIYTSEMKVEMYQHIHTYSLYRITLVSSIIVKETDAMFSAFHPMKLLHWFYLAYLFFLGISEVFLLIHIKIDIGSYWPENWKDIKKLKNLANWDEGDGGI